MAIEIARFEFDTNIPQVVSDLENAGKKMDSFTKKVEEANTALEKQKTTGSALTEEQEKMSKTGIMQDNNGAFDMYRQMSTAASKLASSVSSLMTSVPNAASSMTKPFIEMRSLVEGVQEAIRSVHFDTSGVVPDALFNKMDYLQARMRALRDDIETYQTTFQSMSAESQKVWNNQSLRTGFQNRALSYVRSVKDATKTNLDTLVEDLVRANSFGDQLRQLGVTDLEEQKKIARSSIVSGAYRTDRLNSWTYMSGATRGTTTNSYIFDRVPRAYAESFMREGQAPQNYQKAISNVSKETARKQRMETYQTLQALVNEGNYSAFNFAKQAGLIQTPGKSHNAQNKIRWLDASKVSDAQLDYVGALAAIEAKHALESMPMYHRSVRNHEDLAYLLGKENRGFDDAYAVMAADKRSAINPYLSSGAQARTTIRSAIKNGWYTGPEISVPKLKIRDLIQIPQFALSEDGTHFVNVNNRQDELGALNFNFRKQGITESTTDEWITAGRSPIIDALMSIHRKGQPRREFVNRSYGYGFDKAGNAVKGMPIIAQLLVDDLFQTDENGNVLFDKNDNSKPLFSEKEHVYGNEKITRKELVNRLASRQATIKLRSTDEQGNEVAPVDYTVLSVNGTGGKVRFIVAQTNDINKLDEEDDRQGLLRRTQFFNEMVRDSRGGLKILDKNGKMVGVNYDANGKPINESLENSDMDTVKAYAKYYDAMRKMLSDSTPIEEIGGKTPKVASINFSAYHDYMDAITGESRKDRRFDGGQFHMPWVADRDFQGRMGMNKFFSMKGDFQKFFREGGGTYVDAKNKEHMYLPGVGTADDEDYAAYLFYLNQLTSRKGNNPVAELNGSLSNDFALSQYQGYKNLKGKALKDYQQGIQDRFGGITTYGEFKKWRDARFLDVMQPDIGILASGDTVSKTFTQGGRITLQNYERFTKAHNGFGVNGPSEELNPEYKKYLAAGTTKDHLLVQLTPQELTEYNYANMAPERGFSLRAMKDSLNYQKNKDFLNPALGSAIVITPEMVSESIDNYRNEMAAMNDPKRVIQTLFSGKDYLSSVVQNDNAAIFNNPAVRARIEERRNDLQDKIAQGYLYLPGIQQSFAASAGLYDPLSGWIKNVTKQDKLYGTTEDLKLHTNPETGEHEIYANTEGNIAEFLATRSPYAVNASVKVQNILKNRKVDKDRRERFQKALDEYSVSKDSAIFNIEDFYRLNTGDFDGDMAFLLANDTTRFGDYVAKTSEQNNRVALEMKRLEEAEERARASIKSDEKYDASFAGFVGRYASATRGMGSAYLAGQAGRTIIPGVNQITRQSLAAIQARANLMYGVATDQPKHPDVKGLSDQMKEYNYVMGEGKTADRGVKQLLEDLNAADENGVGDYSNFDILGYRMPTYNDLIGIHMLDATRIAKDIDPGAFSNLRKAFDASLKQYDNEPEAIREAYKYYTDIFKARTTGEWQTLSGAKLQEGNPILTKLNALVQQTEAELNNTQLSPEDKEAVEAKYEKYRSIRNRFEKRLTDEQLMGITTARKNQPYISRYGGDFITDQEFANSEFEQSKTLADMLYQQRLRSGELRHDEVRQDEQSQKFDDYLNKRRIIAQQMTSYNWSTASQFIPDLENAIEHVTKATDIATDKELPAQHLERFLGGKTKYLGSTIENILTGKSTSTPDAIIGSLAHQSLDEYVAGRAAERALHPLVQGQARTTAMNAAEHAAATQRVHEKMLESVVEMAGLGNGQNADLIENAKSAGVGFVLKDSAKSKDPKDYTLSDFSLVERANQGQNTKEWRDSFTRAKSRFETIQNGGLDPLRENFLKQLFDENQVVMAEGTFFNNDGSQGKSFAGGIPYYLSAKDAAGMYRLYQNDDGSFDQRRISFRFTPDLIAKDRDGRYGVLDYKSSSASGIKGRIQTEFYAHLLEELGKRAYEEPGNTDIQDFKQFWDYKNNKSNIEFTKIIDMFAEGGPKAYTSDYSQQHGQTAFDLVRMGWSNLSTAVREGFIKQMGRDKIKESDLSLGKGRKLNLSRMNWTATGADKDEGYNFDLENYKEAIELLANNDPNFIAAAQINESLGSNIGTKVYEALTSGKMAPNKEYLVQKLTKAEETIGQAASLQYRTSGMRIKQKDNYSRTIADLEKLYTQEDIDTINKYADENETQLAPDVAMMIRDSAANIDKQHQLIEKLRLQGIQNIDKDLIHARTTVQNMQGSREDIFSLYNGYKGLIESLASQNELRKADRFFNTGTGQWKTTEENLYGVDLWAKKQEQDRIDAENVIINAERRHASTHDRPIRKKMREITSHAPTFDELSDFDKQEYAKLEAQLLVPKTREKLDNVELTKEEKDIIDRISRNGKSEIASAKTQQDAYDKTALAINQLKEEADQAFLKTVDSRTKGAAASAFQLINGRDVFLTRGQQQDILESNQIGKLLQSRSGIIEMMNSINQLLELGGKDNPEIPKGKTRDDLEAYAGRLQEQVNAINEAILEVPTNAQTEIAKQARKDEHEFVIKNRKTNEAINGIESAYSDRFNEEFNLREKGVQLDQDIVKQRKLIDDATREGRVADIPELQNKLNQLTVERNDLNNLIVSTESKNRIGSLSEAESLRINGMKSIVNPYAQATDRDAQIAYAKQRADKEIADATIAYNRGEIDASELTSRQFNAWLRSRQIDEGIFTEQTPRDFIISKRTDEERDRILQDRRRYQSMLDNDKISQDDYDRYINSLDEQERNINRGSFVRRLREEYDAGIRKQRNESIESEASLLAEYSGQPMDAYTIAGIQARKFNEKIRARRRELQDKISSGEDEALARQHQDELDQLNAMDLRATYGRYLGGARADQNLRDYNIQKSETSLNRLFGGSAPLSLQETVDDAIANANAQIEQYIKLAGLNNQDANRIRQRYGNTQNLQREVEDAYTRQLETERLNSVRKEASIRERLTGNKISAFETADIAVLAMQNEIHDHRRSLLRRARRSDLTDAERNALLAEAEQYRDENVDYNAYRDRTIREIERQDARARRTNTRTGRDLGDISSDRRLTANERVDRRMEDLRNRVSDQIEKLEKDEREGVYRGRDAEFNARAQELLYYNYAGAESRFRAEEIASDRSFAAKQQSDTLRMQSALENRSLTRDEQTRANQARLIKERDDYLAQQIRDRQMTEAQANAYANRYNDNYLMGLAQQQTDYEFGQRDLTNEMRERELSAALSGRSFTRQEKIDQRIDSLVKRRNEEIERFRKENGISQQAAEAAYLFLHPEAQTEEIGRMAERQQQEQDDLLALRLRNQEEASRTQNANMLHQQELSQQQYQRQRNRQFNRSRIAQALYSLEDRKTNQQEAVRGYTQRNEALERRQNEINSELSRTDLSEQDREKLISEQSRNAETINANNEAITRANDEIRQLSTVGAQAGAVFKSLGSSLGMVAQRLGRQLFRRALNEAKKFVQEFDKSMTTIQMITLKSDSQMSTLGDGLIAKAKELKISISEITQSAETLYRQGLSDEEVNERLDIISKFSKVSGTKVDAATKLITVAMNTGLVTDPQIAADIVTALGDNAATNASEIEKGIEKTGAAAAADGTAFAQLASMLTAITSTTQIGGNVAGRTLNTIFGRMNKIGTNELIYDENGHAVSGSAVAKLLAAQGISQYDTNGNKRSSYDVLYDLSQKWDKMSDAEQQQIANAIAGTRQYSNFAAIMQGMSEGKVSEYMNLTGSAEGIVDEKYEIYVKSLQASLTDLKNTFDSVVQDLVDKGVIEQIAQAFGDIVTGIGEFISAAGGLEGVIGVLSTIAVLTATIRGGIVGGVAALALVAGLGAAYAVGSTKRDKEEQEKYNLNAKQRYSNYVETSNKDISKREELTNRAEELGKKYDAGTITAKETDELSATLDQLSASFVNAGGSAETASGGIKNWNAIVDAAKQQTTELKQEIDETAEKMSKFALIQAKADYKTQIEKIEQNAGFNESNLETLRNISITTGTIKKDYARHAYFGEGGIVDTFREKGLEDKDIFKFLLPEEDYNKYIASYSMPDGEKIRKIILDNFINSLENVRANGQPGAQYIKGHKHNSDSTMGALLALMQLQGSASGISAFNNASMTEEEITSLDVLLEAIYNSPGVLASILPDDYNWFSSQGLTEEEFIKKAKDGFNNMNTPDEGFVNRFNLAIARIISGEDQRFAAYGNVDTQLNEAADTYLNEVYSQTNTYQQLTPKQQEYVRKKVSERLENAHTENVIPEGYELRGSTLYNKTTGQPDFAATATYRASGNIPYHTAVEQFAEQYVQEEAENVPTEEELEKEEAENITPKTLGNLVSGVQLSSKDLKYANEYAALMRAARSATNIENLDQMLGAEYTEFIQQGKDTQLLSIWQDLQNGGTKYSYKDLLSYLENTVYGTSAAKSKSALLSTAYSLSEMNNNRELMDHTPGGSESLYQTIASATSRPVNWIRENYNEAVQAYQDVIDETQAQYEADVMKRVAQDFGEIDQNRVYSQAEVDEMNKRYADLGVTFSRKLPLGGRHGEGLDIQYNNPKATTRANLRDYTPVYTNVQLAKLAKQMQGMSWDEIIDSNKWTDEEISAVASYSPEFVRYAKMSKEQQASQEGQNLKRNYEIRFNVAGVSDLEEAGKVADGTAAKLEELQKDGHVAIEVEMQLRAEAYESGQNRAKLYGGGTALEQAEAAMSTMKMSREEWYGRIANGEKEADLIAEAQRIDAESNQVLDAETWSQLYLNTSGTTRQAMIDAARRSDFEQVYDTNGHPTGQFKYVGNEDIDRVGRYAGTERPRTESELAAARMRIVNGTLTAETDNALYEAAVDGLGTYGQQVQHARENGKEASAEIKRLAQLEAEQAAKEARENEALEKAQLGSQTVGGAFAYQRAQYEQNNKSVIAAEQIFGALDSNRVKDWQDLMNVVNGSQASNFKELINSSAELSKKLYDMGVTVDDSGNLDFSALKNSSYSAADVLNMLKEAAAGASDRLNGFNEVLSTGESAARAQSYFSGEFDVGNKNREAFASYINNDAIAQIVRNNEEEYATAQREYNEYWALPSKRDRKAWRDEHGYRPEEPGEFDPFAGLEGENLLYAQSLYANAAYGNPALSEIERIDGFNMLFGAARNGTIDELRNADLVGYYQDYVGAVSGGDEYLRMIEQIQKYESSSGAKVNLNDYDQLSKAFGDSGDEASRFLQIQKDVRAELAGASARATKKAGEYTDAYADSLSKLNKGGVTARKEMARLTDEMKDYQDGITAAQRSKGKTGKQIVKDKTAAKMFSQYLGFDEDGIKTWGKDEAARMSDLLYDTIQEQFSEENFRSMLQGAFDDISASVGGDPIEIDKIIDLIVNPQTGNIDYSAFVALLQSIDSDYAAIAEEYSGHLLDWFITITKKMNGDSASVSVDRSVGKLKSGSGKNPYNKRSSSGGGGGKTKTDALIEGQSHYIKRREHDVNMAQERETRYEKVNNYQGYLNALDDEIAAQERLKGQYEANIVALKEQLSTLKEGSEEWYKCQEAIDAAEESMAKVDNEIDAINSKKINIVETKQANQDKPISHASTMLGLKAENYLERGQFENYAAVTQAQIANYNNDIALNNTQIAEWEELLKTYEEGSQDWITVRDKIWALKEENAELENNMLKETHELQKAQIAQIATDLQTALAPIEHEQNMLDTWSGIYQKGHQYGAYRGALTSQNEYNRGQAALYQNSINELQKQMATLEVGSQAWLDARSAIFEYQEALAQVTASIQENDAAIEESYVNEVVTKYEDNSKTAGHELKMAQIAASGYKEAGDYVNYEHMLEVQRDLMGNQLGVQRSSLAEMEELFNSGKLKEGSDQWKALREQIMTLRETVAETENDYAAMVRQVRETKFENAVEQFNTKDNEMQHEIRMIQYQETKYQNAGELTNYGKALEWDNEAQTKRAAAIQEQIDLLEEQRDAAKDDPQLYNKIDAEIMKMEEQLASTNNTIEKNNKLIEKNQENIKKLAKGIEDTLDKEIKARDKLQREMLAGEISVQNSVLDVIKKRYQDEWNLIKKDVEEKKKALNEEKSLINERLQARKNAIDAEDKYEVLAEYQKQLALISADPTRTKDAKELRKKISDLQKELSWDITEQEAKAATEAIDDEIKALDDYTKVHEEDMKELLEDNNNFMDEVKSVMGDSYDDYAQYLAWMQENNEAYKNASAETRQQMEQGWKDTWDKMYGHTETYWTEIAALMSNKDEFLDYMKQSQEYLNASESGRWILEHQWSTAYDEYQASLLDNAEFSDNHDVLEKMSEMKDWTYKVEPIKDASWDYGQYSTGLEYWYQRQKDDTTGVAQGAIDSAYDQYSAIIGSEASLYESQRKYEEESSAPEITINISNDGSTGGGSSSGSTTQMPTTTPSDHGYSFTWVTSNGRTSTRSDHGFSSKEAAQKQAEKEINDNMKSEINKLSGTPGTTTYDYAYNQIVARHRQMENSITAYKYGGLIDFTGPAWVDGTKSRPEAFLSAYDTEQIGKLAQALSFVTVKPGFTPSSEYFNSGNSTVGDINITINQAELKDDADFEDVARRVGKAFTKQLTKDGFNLSRYAF